MDHKTIIGAIRWDGWVGEKSKVGLHIAKNLTPLKNRYRLPFFAKVIDDNNVIVDGTTQEIMDEEIAYAKAGGIDYWAFCWYPDGSNLDYQRKLYHSSQNRDDVKWCIILGTNPFGLETDLPWLIERFKENNYQKVADGRPLVYYFGFNESQAAVVAQIRKCAKAANVKDPYIVAMDFSARVAESAKAAGVDAISAYCCAAESGSTYAQLVETECAKWEEYKATGIQVIPFVTTGWDNRPRFEDEIMFGSEHYASSYIEQSSTEEITAHLQQAIDWSKNNKKACPANAVLMYAWNENDEGGWLIPTLYELRDFGRPIRLDAIQRVKSEE